MIYFAFPLFLAGAALIAVPVILHFLRKKMSQVQDFPSFYFLMQSVARKKTRNDLRSLLVLLLRALALICLALAFAWPCFGKPDNDPDKAVVIILDGSFSTASPEFQKLLPDLIESQTRSISPECPAVGLIATNRMTVSGDFTSDGSAIRNFLSSPKKPQPVSCDFSLALYRADRLLAGIKAKKRCIIVLTDRQRLPWKRLPDEPFLTVTDEIKILPETIGEAVNARILSADRTGAGLKVSMLCTGGKDLRGELELQKEDGKSLWKQAVALGSGKTAEVTIPLEGRLTGDDAGHLTLHADGDAIAADNEWFFPPIPKTDRTVQLYSSIHFPALKAALDSPQIRYTESEAWQEQRPDLLIIGDSPLSDPAEVCEKADEMLRSGTSLVLLYQNTPFMRKIFEYFGAKPDDTVKTGSASLEFLDLEHAVFREYRNLGAASWFDLLFFNVPKLVFEKGAGIGEQHDTRIIASWEGGLPAVVEMPRHQAKVFFFAFAPDTKQTNFQTSGHFLPFLRELLEYCAKSAGKRVLYTAAERTVYTPDGALELKEPGIRRLKDTVYCINADRAESETVLLSPDFGVPTGEKKASAELAAEKKEFPFDAKNPLILFVCALAFLLAELGIANRTAL